MSVMERRWVRTCVRNAFLRLWAGPTTPVSITQPTGYSRWRRSFTSRWKKVIWFLYFDLCKRPAQSVAWSTKILEVCLICEYPCGPHPVVGQPWGQESQMALKKVKWVSWRHQTGRWALGHVCGPLQDTKSGTFIVWYKVESTLRCETFISEHSLLINVPPAIQENLGLERKTSKVLKNLNAVSQKF